MPRLPQSVSAATPSVCQCRDCLSLSVPRLPQYASAATPSVSQCRDCLSLSVPRLPQSASVATASVCQYRDCLSLPAPRLPQSACVANLSACHYSCDGLTDWEYRSLSWSAAVAIDTILYAAFRSMGQVMSATGHPIEVHLLNSPL